jgi:hypothetical protein
MSDEQTHNDGDDESQDEERYANGEPIETRWLHLQGGSAPLHDVLLCGIIQSPCALSTVHTPLWILSTAGSAVYSGHQRLDNVIISKFTDQCTQLNWQESGQRCRRCHTSLFFTSRPVAVALMTVVPHLVTMAYPNQPLPMIRAHREVGAHYSAPLPPHYCIL